MLDGSALGPQQLAARQAMRDLQELEQGLPELVDQALLVELADRHGVPRQTLESFCKIMEDLLEGEQKKRAEDLLVE